MRAGTAASLIAHAALIAWGVFALQTRPLDASPMEAIPVSLVAIGDVTTAPKASPPPAVKPTPVVPTPPLPTPAPTPPVAKADPAPPAPTPPPPAPVVAKADPVPTPPAPAPMLKPTADPQPTPAATTAAAEPPKPHVAPPAPPASAAKPPPVKPVPSLDTDALAAVIDKPQPKPAPQPKPQPQPQAQPKPQPQPDTAALGSLIASNSTDTHMTVSEVDALRSRIAACWTPPPGWTDPAEVRVVLVISLNPDGSVAAAPDVVQAPVGRYQQAAPESAVRAVRACAPYVLPAAKYEDWKEVQITFDPRAMTG